MTEARLAADVGLPRGLMASLVLPLRLVSTTIQYFDAAGAAVELTNPGVHHRDETLTGLGDPMVLLGGGRTIGGWRIGGRAGVTLPLGRTEDDPFVLGDQGRPHEHIQMGTGTVNAVAAIEVGRGWGRWRAGGFAFTQQVGYANGQGYQAGDRYAGGLDLRRSLGTRWTLRGGVEVQGETAERWAGVVHTDDGNRGRIDVMLAAGASWRVGGGVGLDLGFKVPVITHVVGGQLDMPAILELGVSWSFGGRADAHHHDHGDDHDHHDHDDHGDGDHDDDDDDHANAAAAWVHPDTSGLDVADLPEPTAATPLVPVPGKVTIVDVWATWCGPCRVLEPILVDLVRAHPETVALRRIDVTESETWSPVLPHVVVFDAAGAQVLARSSDGNLDALVEAVRGVVEPTPPPTPTPPRTTAPAPTSPPPPRPVAPAPQRIAITVTDVGFQPGAITVPVGKPVTLVFERTTDRTCATEVVMTIAGKRLERALPLDRPVELTVTFPTAGTITYACAMDMVRGTITAR